MCVQKSNLYNKMMMSRELSVNSKKIMKPVLILFEWNVFGETQNCTSTVHTLILHLKIIMVRAWWIHTLKLIRLPNSVELFLAA